MNPTTAYNMLSDFVDLQPGDWVVQNGANSAVRRSTTDKNFIYSIGAGGASCYFIGQVEGVEHNKPHPKSVRLPP